MSKLSVVDLNSTMRIMRKSSQNMFKKNFKNNL